MHYYCPSCRRQIINYGKASSSDFEELNLDFGESGPECESVGCSENATDQWTGNGTGPDPDAYN